MISTTNFIGSDGVDVGSRLLEREYFNSVYLNIANQYITPELWVWGKGDFGQLGNNSSTDKSTPITTFSGGANWKQISCGGDNVAAIKTDGSLWVWGYAKEINDAFNTPQLGININDGISRSTPVTTFAGGNNWKQVSVGFMHMCAIKTDGSLWCWGYNATGNLGTTDTLDKLTPVTTFAGGFNWKQVSCGKFHTAAIKTDGSLWTWGWNNQAQLGDNTTNQRCTPIQTFSGGNNWKQVFCSEGHTTAIKTDGTLWTWGRNAESQLGTNDILARSTPVTTFAGGNNWKQVSCGHFHNLAIKTDGSLWVWGFNSSGQLGNNTTQSRSIPTITFLAGNNWRQTSGGREHSSAIKTDGTLWVWGQGAGGRMGHNASDFRVTAITTFAGGNNWKQVSCGYQNTVAIRSYDEY